MRSSWRALARAGLAAGALSGAWLMVLVVLGVALAPRQGRATQARLAESLQATATIGALDLALVRGRLAIDGLSIQRDDGPGRMSIEVAGVVCELAPLGLALLDRDCRTLSVRNLRMEVTSSALLRQRRPSGRRPIRARALELQNAVLVFSPSAFAPDLGRIEIAIERALAGPTVLRTPLSWLFSLRELVARLELPAGVTLRLTYRDGVMTATGALLGSAPIAIPVELPVDDLARDAHEEMRVLLRLGKQIAQRLVARRAEDWLRSTLGR
jgi:hypothetical protein